MHRSNHAINFINLNIQVHRIIGKMEANSCLKLEAKCNLIQALRQKNKHKHTHTLSILRDALPISSSNML